MRLRILALLLLLAPAALAAQSDSSAPVLPPAAVLPERLAAGAFSASQVAMGEDVFMAYCVSCHEPSFHTGEQFRFSWLGRTVLDYFKQLKRTMPEDNPGGLSDDDYTRVIAYILKLNGFAPGTDSLKSDTLELKRVRISEPSGSP
ncbi:MAG: cytochrome c [Gemmatimonadaceae bacterium]